MRLLGWLIATPMVAAAMTVLVVGPKELAPPWFAGLVGVYLVASWLAMTETPRAFGWAAAGSLVVLMAYWSLIPSHHRSWEPEHSVLPRVEIAGDVLTVEGLRAFRWSEGDVERAWRDQDYDLSQLQGMDFVVSHFGEIEGIAHTLLSFRFADGTVLAVSPEIRKELGESYSPTRGLFRNYELLYVLADERDVLHTRTHVREERVYIHPIDIQPETARTVLEEIVRRVQSIEDHPSWYNTATASCATTLAADLQAVADPPLKLDWRVLVPGFSDELAFELGFLIGEDLNSIREANFADPAKWSGDGDYSAAMRR